MIPEICTTADYVDHSRPPGAPGGLDGVRAVFQMFRGGFPDVHFTIELMVAEGDHVATHVTGRGTNDGAFMGTRRRQEVAPVGDRTGIFRVARRQDRGALGQPDLLALLSQIGAHPAGGRCRPRLDTSSLATRPDVAPRDPDRPA